MWYWHALHCSHIPTHSIVLVASWKCGYFEKIVTLFTIFLLICNLFAPSIHGIIPYWNNINALEPERRCDRSKLYRSSVNRVFISFGRPLLSVNDLKDIAVTFMERFSLRSFSAFSEVFLLRIVFTFVCIFCTCYVFASNVILYVNAFCLFS